MKLLRQGNGCKMFRLDDGRYKVEVRSAFLKPVRFSYYYLSLYDAGKDMDMFQDHIRSYREGNGIRAIGSAIGKALSAGRRVGGRP